MSLNILASPGEQKVSTGAAGFNRTNSAIAGLGDGGWVVTWTSNETTSGDIYQRRYTKAGATSGGDILVNSLTGNAQTDPAIAALPDSGWAITWTSKLTGDGDVVGRVYDGKGATSGADVMFAGGIGTQRQGDLAILPSGNLVLAWSANEPGSTGFDPRGAIFAPDGTVLASALGGFVVSLGSNEYDPVVLTLPSGQSIIAYDSNTVVSGDSFDTLYAVGFVTSGSPITPSSVNGKANVGTEKPDLIKPVDGPTLMIYQQEAVDGSGYAILMTELGGSSPKQVNTFTNNDQINPKAAALDDGGYVIVWQSKNQFAVGSGWDIYQQRYDADGNKVGPESRVNGATTGAQLDPDVTALDDGGWIVSWTSDQSGKPEIYQRRYTPTGLSLSQSEVTEKGDPFIGFLQPTMADGASIAWSLVDSAGGRFKITPGTNQLVVANAAAIDGDEGEDSYTITVKATAGGASETQTFKITRNDVDEKPVNLHLIGSGPVKIAENSNAGIAVMAVEANDPENAAITYSLTANGGGAFKIDAATGVVSVADKTKLDYETNKTLDIEVKASDPAGNFVKAGFTVTIEDVDETVTPPGGGGTNNAPTGVSLSGASVDELALNGTVVGKLSAIDPDAMQTFSYQLSDDAGGRFVLLGDTLYVLNGVALDFEQAGAHRVTVVATDQGGLSKTQTLSIAVGDIHNEKSAGTGFADTLFGDYGKDVFSGGGGNDVLKGFKNADTLTGGAGNDRLFGGLGRDKLLGGKGKDVFVFDTKPASANVDTLKDFSHKDDTVWLENALFKGIGSGSLSKPKKMKADAFFLGKEAHDANDRILYDKAKGALWYDADGSGSHAAVKIAVLTTKPALTLSDFYVI